MKKITRLQLYLVLLFFSSSVFSQDEKEKNLNSGLFDLSLEDLLDIDVNEQGLKLYGYFNTNLEKVFHEPYVDGSGVTQYDNPSAEWLTPNFHLYGSSKLNDKIDVLFNLANNGYALEVRNAWGNIKVNDYLQFRFGKMYRKFGLFNEKLDQLPTFYGIEPPELFDKDHLMLPRTTVFMVHGITNVGLNELEYSLNTGNGEGVDNISVIPLGGDIRFKTYDMVVGASFYLSGITSEKATPSVTLGQGAPEAGVLPWMSGDKYNVFGGFAEKSFGKVHIQTAFWNANHDAERDPEGVMQVLNNAGISQTQKENFFGASASVPDSLLTSGNVLTKASYNVQTFYIRVGYEIHTSIGAILPYAFIDWMKHPETIKSKDWGGDNEAGFADDGQFLKPSLGLIYKPTDNVALKLDGSMHMQKFNGKSEQYPEIRFDVSFAFK